VDRLAILTWSAPISHGMSSGLSGARILEAIDAAAGEGCPYVAKTRRNSRKPATPRPSERMHSTGDADSGSDVDTLVFSGTLAHPPTGAAPAAPSAPLCESGPESYRDEAGNEDTARAHLTAVAKASRRIQSPKDVLDRSRSSGSQPGKGPVRRLGSASNKVAPSDTLGSPMSPRLEAESQAMDGEGDGDSVCVVEDQPVHGSPTDVRERPKGSSVSSSGPRGTAAIAHRVIKQDAKVSLS
jgi:hypothetical protein